MKARKESVRMDKYKIEREDNLRTKNPEMLFFNKQNKALGLLGQAYTNQKVNINLYELLNLKSSKIVPFHSNYWEMYPTYK